MSLLSLMLLLPRSNPAVTLSRKVLSKLRTSTRNLHRLCLTCLCLRAPVAAQAFVKQQRKKKIAARATYGVFLLSHGSSSIARRWEFNCSPQLQPHATSATSATCHFSHISHMPLQPKATSATHQPLHPYAISATSATSATCHFSHINRISHFTHGHAHSMTRPMIHCMPR
jgi:hypothetical protein